MYLVSFLFFLLIVQLEVTFSATCMLYTCFCSIINFYLLHDLQAEVELVKIDINCHIQGDIVLECISLHDDTGPEKMMYRVMFNTAFIKSNMLTLNRDEIDLYWDAKDQFSKDFRAEVFFLMRT